MKHLSVKCKADQPFIERTMAGPFKWIVYNRTTGYVVAATYSEDMAAAILRGIGDTQEFVDIYSVTELYSQPESRF